MDMKRVLIADDHACVIKALRVVLRHEQQFEVVGETDSGLEALSICKSIKPDIIILDLMLKELSGIEVLRRTRRDMPDVAILIYTGFAYGEIVAKAMRHDPHGLISKLDDLDVLRSALHAVSSGGTY